MVKILWFTALVGALATSFASAADELNEADFLGDFPVVLTASRLEQATQDAPNSISVIDRSMIAASGFQNLAELFQLVPGFYVAQKSGYSFSVFSGVGDEYSRQLQVLVDGRSVYLPTTGGVAWDTLPLAIADIDRIEVVRGPDAASYGANAMMGVINIITRRPAEVEGHTLAVTAGSENTRDLLYRWAGGEDSKHRVTLGWQQNDGLSGLNDSTRAPLFNYSGDIDVGPGRSLNLQLGYMGGSRGAGELPQYGDGSALVHDTRINSQYQQIDYRAGLSAGGEWLFKTYHNYLMEQETVPYGPPSKKYPILLPGSYDGSILGERWHIETQWNRPLNDAARYSVGLYVRRDTSYSPLYFGNEQDYTASSQGVFSHVEWRLTRNWLLNAGAMWEDYELVGNRVSPHLTMSWQPSPNHTFRMGVSRAYRDPLEFEKYAGYALTFATQYGPKTLQSLAANPAILPESDLSQEIGYLGHWPQYGLSLDLRFHLDSLQNQINFAAVSGKAASANVGNSEQRGIDGQLRWRFSPHSFVQLNYGYLHIDSSFATIPYFPPLLASLLVSHRFDHEIDVSLGYYQGDTMRMLSGDKPPAYHRTNLRFAKELKQDGHPARLALILQGLGAPHFGYNYDPTDGSVRDLISRQAYLQYTLDY